MIGRIGSEEKGGELQRARSGSVSSVSSVGSVGKEDAKRKRENVGVRKGGGEEDRDRDSKKPPKIVGGGEGEKSEWREEMKRWREEGKEMMNDLREVKG